MISMTQVCDQCQTLGGELVTRAQRLLFDLGLWSSGSEVSKAPLAASPRGVFVDSAQVGSHGSPAFCFD